MKKLGIFICLVLGVCTTTVIEAKENDQEADYQFAVVSDPHVQDVEGEFTDTDFSGANLNGKNYTLRPMEEQMTSTRLFNENYYAFYQVLDEIAEDGIKDVVFTGDISDDGQEMNITKIAEILEEYEQEYAINFYIVPGNHEPPSPIAVDKGDNFLTDSGESIDVQSTSSDSCQNGDENVACDDQMLSMGQVEMANTLGDFGYMPEEDNLLWATPYSSYELADYTYEQAHEEMDLSKRTYESCGDERCENVSDLTYLVQPAAGYLFLCLDGDIYVPEGEDDYKLFSDNGLNELAEYKPETIEFIKDVINYADENDLQLIFFNHYPLVDYYAGMTDELKAIFGEDGLEFDRLPENDVTSSFAQAGAHLMFSGHMHYNATAEYANDDNYLVNVMTSSTAAYVPSYKVVSSFGSGKYEIETKILDDVKDFNTLFELYKIEYAYEQSLTDAEQEELGIAKWDPAILEADNYYDYNRIFLETLVQTRHYKEWDSTLHDTFDNLNLYDLVVYSTVSKKLSPSEYLAQKDCSQQIQKRSAAFNHYLASVGVKARTLKSIDGIDVVTTFYKFLNARELAYQDYSDETINAYSAAITYASNNQKNSNSEYTDGIITIFTAINAFANDCSSNHFAIDLNDQTITNLAPEQLHITNELE